jgi:acyl-CoA synthetase (AMP-forming)/AMP-acid ligase II
VSLIDKGNTNKTVEEIHEYVNSQLPLYKQLSGRIFVIDSFPRTGSGKIKRFELV